MQGRTRNRLAWVGALLFIGAAVLAYGYWRALARAYVSVSLSDETNFRKRQPVFNADIVVRDSNDRILAKGKSDARHGVVRFSHPQYGSCEEEGAANTTAAGRQRWRSCIGEIFRWQAGWAEKVRSMEIRIEGCAPVKIPLTLRMRPDDWWLWWVPLPHVGGDPMTSFSAWAAVNRATCRVRAG